MRSLVLVGYCDDDKKLVKFFQSPPKFADGGGLNFFNLKCMSNTAFPIQTVSDTALGVAFCRFLECDPFARILAGDRGEQIIHTVAKKNLDSIGWEIVTRTCLIDRFL